MKEHKHEVDPNLVWKAIFQALKRHCASCDRDFECYYSCEEEDRKNNHCRKESPTFCFCAQCYKKQFGIPPKFSDKPRLKCHLLKK